MMWLQLSGMKQGEKSLAESGVAELCCNVGSVEYTLKTSQTFAIQCIVKFQLKSDTDIVRRHWNPLHLNPLSSKHSHSSLHVIYYV